MRSCARAGLPALVLFQITFQRMSMNIFSLSGHEGKELEAPLWARLQQAATNTGTPTVGGLTIDRAADREARRTRRPSMGASDHSW